MSRIDATSRASRPVDRTDPACAGCAAGSSRREFLLQGASAVGALLAGLGITADAAAMLPVREGEGGRSKGTELRFPIPADDGVTIDRRNELILVRWQDAVYAFALSCPHQRTMLKWRESDQRFQCPKHKSKYRPDGVFISGRATRGMDRYALRLAGDGLVVETGAALHQDENETAWNAAAVRLPGP